MNRSRDCAHHPGSMTSTATPASYWHAESLGGTSIQPIIRPVKRLGPHHNNIDPLSSAVTPVTYIQVCIECASSRLQRATRSACTLHAGLAFCHIHTGFLFSMLTLLAPLLE